jgi:hypothetical protein
MIEEDNLKHFNKFKNCPPHQSYIAGFIDGDGCIFIRKIKHGFQSGVTITQCRTNILRVIRYHFGGNITSSGNKNNNSDNLMNENNYYDKYNKRNQYNLLIRSNEYKNIIKYIKYSMVIKHGQIESLDTFSKLVNSQNTHEQKVELFTKCRDLNNGNFVNNVKFDNINIEYISGLFDAEGCFYIDSKKINKFYISLTQKKHPQVLEYISKFIGFGKIDYENKYKIYNKADCLKFIQIIKPHLIVKYNQSQAFETYLTTDNSIIKEQMYAVCNREKHEIEIFTELNRNDKGKDGFNENNRLTNIKEKIFKDILLKNFYLKKSESMKGVKNHNYGKTFSEETKKKMSNAIRESKDSVSDEIILHVRLLLEKGDKNVDIQQKLSIPRHTVTRIKNGTLVCRDEKKWL